MSDEPQIPTFLLKPAPIEPTDAQLAAAVIAYGHAMGADPMTTANHLHALRAAVRAAINERG